MLNVRRRKSFRTFTRKKSAEEPELLTHGVAPESVDPNFVSRKGQSVDEIGVL